MKKFNYNTKHPKVMKTSLLVILTFLGMHQITFGQNTLIGKYLNVQKASFQNSFTGSNAGHHNIKGSMNTFTGVYAGYQNTNGHYNTFIGNGAGYENTTGKYNTYIGAAAGIFNKKGSGNVCIGFQTGMNLTGSNQLYISNNLGLPLIYGNFASKRVGIGTITPTEKFQVEGRIRLGSTNAGVWYEAGATDWFVGRGASSNHFRFSYGGDKMTLTNDGKLGIGTATPQARLHVNGTSKFASELTGTSATFSGNLKASQVILNIGSFPDYVFAPQYKLMPLEQVEAYINKHQHLPKVPAAAQVIKEGMNVGQINVLLMEKVEELTLHTIAQHKQIEQLKEKVQTSEQELKTKVQALEQQLNIIKELLKKK